jgi:hypothetical protein
MGSILIKGVPPKDGRMRPPYKPQTTAVQPAAAPSTR